MSSQSYLKIQKILLSCLQHYLIMQGLGKIIISWLTRVGQLFSNLPILCHTISGTFETTLLGDVRRASGHNNIHIGNTPFIVLRGEEFFVKRPNENSGNKRVREKCFRQTVGVGDSNKLTSEKIRFPDKPFIF